MPNYTGLINMGIMMLGIPLTILIIITISMVRTKKSKRGYLSIFFCFVFLTAVGVFMVYDSLPPKLIHIQAEYMGEKYTSRGSTGASTSYSFKLDNGDKVSLIFGPFSRNSIVNDDNALVIGETYNVQYDQGTAIIVFVEKEI